MACFEKQLWGQSVGMVLYGEHQMDGIDENRGGGEFAWAVRTALVSVNEGDCGLFDHVAEQFVEDTYHFIVAEFEGEGLEPPTKAKLVEAVRQIQEEGVMDWIFDHVLEGGHKLFNQRIADEHWNEICRKMRSARIELPSRAEIDRYILRRLDS